MVTSLLQLPGVAAREQTGAGRGALGIAIVGLGEEDSLLGNSVKVGSFDIFGPIGAKT